MMSPFDLAWARNEEGIEVDSDELDELTGIMSRLAEGDEAAVITLYQRFGDRIAGTVRAVLRERGLTLVRDEVDGLVFDACLAVAAVAKGWSPDGGALPWTWGRRRIERCVDRLLGVRTVPLDEHLHMVESRYAAVGVGVGVGGWAGDGGETRGEGGRHTLSRALAARVAVDSRFRLLDDAFDRAALSPLDREVCLQYAAEQHTGNRSPATTVGAMFALKEPTVRQRVRRSRARLRQLAEAETRFAPLAQLALLS
jgi:DNA-directed RNA polymerase specialized sigma24 family protein